jgi:hypothetical protein
MGLEELYKSVEEFGKFQGVGVSLHGNFIHCDKRENKARWQYNHSGKDVPWDGKWSSLTK